MRTVTIDAALNGFIVKVGCQTLVYSDRRTLLDDLDAYMADPAKKEADMRETALNKRLLQAEAAIAQPAPNQPMPECAAPTVAAERRR